MESNLKGKLKEIANFVIQNNLSLRDIMDEMEKTLIETALKKTKFNKVKAAKLLKLHRNTIRLKIKKLGINDEETIEIK